MNEENEEEKVDFNEMFCSVLERKTLRKLDQFKKKRAKLSVKGTANSLNDKIDYEVLCKEVPFDQQIGYNLLSELVEEDEEYMDESLYKSNCLAMMPFEEKKYLAFFPDDTQRLLSCQSVNLSIDKE